jgi:endo-1,4-beta-xylanase
MRHNKIKSAFSSLVLSALAVNGAYAQTPAPVATPPPPAGQAVAAPVSITGKPLPPIPAAVGLPKPGPATDAPYVPLPILQGGIVVPIFHPNSPYLKADKIKEAEVYNMSRAVPGRVGSIVSIHNPSIEFHPVDRGLNTGAVIILVAGGGHRTLNVGTEGADFVPFFYNYGINTVILRNRMRVDGYNAVTDSVYDALQAIRVVRGYAKEWNIDPNKIGIMGFSAGAELSAPAAVQFEDFDRNNLDPNDPFSGISSRPDFTGIIYPGPTPFAAGRTAPPIPRNTPPAFIATGGSGDRSHAVWAMEYFSAMLNVGIPNIEMHVYGNGRHPGDPLPDGTNQTGGLTDRGNTPFGTWQYRFIDWFRDLGFMGKPGVETKAAKDIAVYMTQPVPGRGGGGGRGGAAGAGGRGGATPPAAPGTAPATPAPGAARGN